MNMPPNYTMGGGIPMATFPMQQGMNPQQQQQQQHQQHQHHQQQMMQRMQASQPNANMSTPTPQRNFQGQPPQGTPTSSNGQAIQQSQFPGTQNAQGPHQAQPANNTQQQQIQTQAQAQGTTSLNSIQTPQTPTFPTPAQGNSTNGTSSVSTPLSPGADPKDKERVGVILEINNELLLEAMQIQSTQHIIRKERAVNGTDGNTNDGDKKPTEDEQLSQDYIQ
jgi:hypothetical protein